MDLVVLDGVADVVSLKERAVGSAHIDAAYGILGRNEERGGRGTVDRAVYRGAIACGDVEPADEAVALASGSRRA